MGDAASGINNRADGVIGNHVEAAEDHDGAILCLGAEKTPTFSPPHFGLF